MPEKKSHTTRHGTAADRSLDRLEADDAKGRLFKLLGNITAQESVEGICRTVVEGVRKHLGFERAGLFLWDQSAQRFRGTFGTDLEGMTREESAVFLGEDDEPGGPVDRILAGSVFERGCRLGQPVARPGEENVKADLVALRVNERLYGVLSVDNRISQREITEQELKHLMLMSQVLGNALDMARARRDLALSEERFRQVAENSREWIWELDARGVYVYSSPVVQTILGRAAETVVGHHLIDFIAQEERQKLTDMLARCETTRKSFQLLRHTELHQNGHAVILESSGIPLFGADGKLKGFRGAHRDITREMELETQLRHSQKMDVIGRLAGGIAHDFNNLLTSIIGASSLLLEEIDPENPLRSDLEQIRASGERAAALTRQLQSFTRRQDIHVGSLLVNDVVRDLEKILRRTLGEDIELVAQLDPHIEPVMADVGQLEQVIMQLAVNAREAMIELQAHCRPGAPEGGGAKQLVIRTAGRVLDEAFCETHPEFTPGHYVMLSVSDNGIGMSSEIKEHLFEPFFSTKGVGRGTGLGLSTVYGIIKQLGGGIRVDSAPGKGATFEIYLRVATQREVWTRRDAPASALRGKETILVVEDEDAVRGLIVRILQSLGYTTLQAVHGGEGLAVCTSYQKPIDLIISDLIMPHMSGKQFIEEVRKIRSDVKVLFVSGYSNFDTVDGDVLGVDTPLIQKPFTKESLATRVREVIENRWKPSLAAAGS